MTFGISTYLFYAQRLDRGHLDAISASGFEALELFALRSHVDYHDRGALAQLDEALRASGLTLHSVHAPLHEGYVNGRWSAPLSIGATDAAVRGKAVGETRAVLDAAQVVPYRYLVVHLDGPGPDTGAVASSFDAVRRSLDELYPLAVSRGVALAFEVLGTPISSPDALVRTIDQLELDAAGVCLDVGHAHAAGGVIDAVETVSGSLWTTHIHDSSATGGRHLVPFAGVIDWSGALLSLQKVGYEGPYIMELEGGSDPLEVLRRAASARRRLEAILAS